MTKPTAIGINIYGGGFTLGVSRYFKVLGQWEEIKLGKKTFEMNFPKLFRPLDRSQWPVAAAAEAGVDLVYANPPCAPWSQANNHAGKTKASRFLDARLALTAHTMEAALAIEPTVFMSESVEAAYNTGVLHYYPFADMWIKKGYQVTFFLTDAVLHGAPCQRRRFHFIASKYDLQLGKVPKIETPLTVREVIGDLEDPATFGTVALHEPAPMNPKYKKLLKHVPPGGKLQELINRIPGYEGPKAGFLVRRLRWDTVAPTMVGFTFIHPNGTRWITFREAMRLCTYPDTFMAHSAIEAVDAVLPVVAEFLASVAKKTIARKEPQVPGLNLVDWRPHGRIHHMNRGERKLDYSAAARLGT